jgi:hypothetical protein
VHHAYHAARIIWLCQEATNIEKSCTFVGFNPVSYTASDYLVTPIVLQTTLVIIGYKRDDAVS